MKVLVVIPTLGFGGAERLLITLLPKLKEYGLTIKVCTFHSTLDISQELYHYNISVVNLNLKHRWSIFEAIYKLAKEIRKFKPDILWSHLYFGIIYSRLVSIFFRKIKVITVLHYHASSDSTKKGLWYLFRNWLFSKSKRFDFATIAVSNSVKEDYEKYYDWQNIEVIYNAIDTSKMDDIINNADRKKTIKELEIQQSCKLITVPGRLHESKGHKYLIEAIGVLKKRYNFTPKVIIAGAGNLSNSLKILIEELELQEQFIFTGNVEQTKLFEIICASDIIVIPSLFEAFGLVAIEAMYLNKPVVVSNIGGLAEITKDQYDAIHVPVKDSHALYLAIKELSNNDEKVLYLSNNAKKTALNFSLNHIVQKWIHLFKREIN